MTGAVRILKNTLTAHNVFGSYFAIEVIRIKGSYGAALPVAPEAYPLCGKCGLCAANCPTNALDNGFLTERCLRQQQAKGFVGASDAVKCGNMVWGCNICQTVCPANRGIGLKEFVEPRLLCRRKLFDCAMKGRAGMESYAAIMGENYARPAKMAALVINAITNAADLSFSEEIKGLVLSADERISAAAARYVQSIAAHTEREVKFLIGREEYERAVEALPCVTQVNHYFASGAENGEYNIRIRLKEDAAELTLKIRREQAASTLVSDEYNLRIAADDVAGYLDDGIAGKYINTVFGTHIPEDLPFLYIGSLTTVRTAAVIGEFDIEFDKNEYLGITDYEAECECDSEEEAKRAEEYLAKRFKTAPASPKSKRFSDRLKALEHSAVAEE